MGKLICFLSLLLITNLISFSKCQTTPPSGTPSSDGSSPTTVAGGSSSTTAAGGSGATGSEVDGKYETTPFQVSLCQCEEQSETACNKQFEDQVLAQFHPELKLVITEHATCKTILPLDGSTTSGSGGGGSTPSTAAGGPSTPSTGDTPAPGAPTTTPAPGAPTTTPAPGAPTTTPAAGAPTTTPAPGAPTTTPAPGAPSSTPASGGTTVAGSTASGGGGQYGTILPGWHRRCAIAGTFTDPKSGSSQPFILHFYNPDFKQKKVCVISYFGARAPPNYSTLSTMATTPSHGPIVEGVYETTSIKMLICKNDATSEANCNPAFKQKVKETYKTNYNLVFAEEPKCLSILPDLPTTVAPGPGETPAPTTPATPTTQAPGPTTTENVFLHRRCVLYGTYTDPTTSQQGPMRLHFYNHEKDDTVVVMAYFGYRPVPNYSTIAGSETGSTAAGGSTATTAAGGGGATPSTAAGGGSTPSTPAGRRRR